MILVLTTFVYIFECNSQNNIACGGDTFPTKMNCFIDECRVGWWSQTWNHALYCKVNGQLYQYLDGKVKFF